MWSHYLAGYIIMAALSIKQIKFWKTFPPFSDLWIHCALLSPSPFFSFPSLSSGYGYCFKVKKEEEEKKKGYCILANQPAIYYVAVRKQEAKNRAEREREKGSKQYPSNDIDEISLCLCVDIFSSHPLFLFSRQPLLFTANLRRNWTWEQLFSQAGSVSRGDKP